MSIVISCESAQESSREAYRRELARKAAELHRRERTEKDTDISFQMSSTFFLLEEYIYMNLYIYIIYVYIFIDIYIICKRMTFTSVLRTLSARRLCRCSRRSGHGDKG